MTSVYSIDMLLEIPELIHSTAVLVLRAYKVRRKSVLLRYTNLIDIEPVHHMQLV